MNEINENYGMGWLPDYPDFRDYTDEHELIKPMLAKVNIYKIDKVSLPNKVDLRQWCSPIENQG